MKRYYRLQIFLIQSVVTKIGTQSQNQDRLFKESEHKMGQYICSIQKPDLEIDWYNGKIEAEFVSFSLKPVIERYIKPPKSGYTIG